MKQDLKDIVEVFEYKKLPIPEKVSNGSRLERINEYPQRVYLLGTYL